MPLQFDMHTAEITYQGRKVGEYRVEHGVAKVTLDFTYECGIEEWIVPLSWFDYGLNLLQKHQVNPREVALEVETEDDDIAEHFTALRLLTEKTIKQDGYIWRFHKNDPDPWPSVIACSRIRQKPQAGRHNRRDLRRHHTRPLHGIEERQTPRHPSSTSALAGLLRDCRKTHRRFQYRSGSLSPRKRLFFCALLSTSNKHSEIGNIA